MNVRCPNLECNIKFEPKPDQKKCLYCGTVLFGKNRGKIEEAKEKLEKGEEREGLFVCTTCGYVGKPKTRLKGNLLTEIILWFFLMLPGFFYTVWRYTTKEQVCPACENPTMIPTMTPKGKELLKE